MRLEGSFAGRDDFLRPRGCERLPAALLVAAMAAAIAGSGRHRTAPPKLSRKIMQGNHTADVVFLPSVRELESPRFEWAADRVDFVDFAQLRQALCRQTSSAWGADATTVLPVRARHRSACVRVATEKAFTGAKRQRQRVRDATARALGDGNRELPHQSHTCPRKREVFHDQPSCTVLLVWPAFGPGARRGALRLRRRRQSAIESGLFLRLGRHGRSRQHGRCRRSGQLRRCRRVGRCRCLGRRRR